MRVLVTRPAKDGEEIARLLKQRGHQVLLAPLFRLEFKDGPELALDDVQAVLATSANGVRALARRTPRRDVPVFAVGPQTSAEAQKHGFLAVRNADGDAGDLALAARQWALPGKGALLHVAGEGNDGKLLAMLGGFSLRQEILYAARPVAEMPQAAAAALARGEVDAALFFSPRSAEIFRQCAVKQHLPLEKVGAACISAATAQALAPLAFARIDVASRPNQMALLALLD